MSRTFPKSLYHHTPRFIRFINEERSKKVVCEKKATLDDETPAPKKDAVLCGDQTSPHLRKRFGEGLLSMCRRRIRESLGVELMEPCKFCGAKYAHAHADYCPRGE